MPYKDEEKKKQYYERYQKHYNKRYKEDHKIEWNNYQKEYKRKKRFEVVANIRKSLLEINMGEPQELSFKAAVIFMFICVTGIKKTSSIAYRTGYDIIEVRTIFDNWCKNGILCDGKFDVEFTDAAFENVIELTLISLVGAGELIREQKFINNKN